MQARQRLQHPHLCKGVEPVESFALTLAPCASSSLRMLPVLSLLACTPSMHIVKVYTLLCAAQHVHAREAAHRIVQRSAARAVRCIDICMLGEQQGCYILLPCADC